MKFGDCTLAEFSALCDQRGLRGIERHIWISLFKRCANAPGTRETTKRQQRIINAFIEEDRKLIEPSVPIA